MSLIAVHEQRVRRIGEGEGRETVLGDEAPAARQGN